MVIHGDVVECHLLNDCMYSFNKHVLGTSCVPDLGLCQTLDESRGKK